MKFWCARCGTTEKGCQSRLFENGGDFDCEGFNQALTQWNWNISSDNPSIDQPADSRLSNQTFHFLPIVKISPVTNAFSPEIHFLLIPSKRLSPERWNERNSWRCRFSSFVRKKWQISFADDDPSYAMCRVSFRLQSSKVHKINNDSFISQRASSEPPQRTSSVRQKLSSLSPLITLWIFNRFFAAREPKLSSWNY